MKLHSDQKNELDPRDRERWQQELATRSTDHDGDDHERVFAFRCGNEWFAIDPTNVLQVDRMPVIHSIPDRPEALAGLINLRGVVTLCFSLKEILQCAPGPEAKTPLLLTLAQDGWQVGCQIDEAISIISFSSSATTPPPATLEAVASCHVTQLFSFNGHNVACLDADLLFNTFKKVAQ